MKVDALVTDLMAKFPRHADEIEGWTPSFVRVLGDAEGPRLKRAYELTIDRWDKFFPPRPTEFLPNLPAARSSDRADVAAALFSGKLDKEMRALANRTIMYASDEIRAQAGDRIDRPSRWLGKTEITFHALFIAHVEAWVRKEGRKTVAPLMRGGAAVPQVYPFTPADWDVILAQFDKLWSAADVTIGSVASAPRVLGAARALQAHAGLLGAAEEPRPASGQISQNERLRVEEGVEWLEG